MGLVQTVAPTTEPVLRADLKLHSRIIGTDQDPIIDLFLMSSREYVETRLSRQMITATWEYTFDSFDETYIDLPITPVASVEDIKYFDTDGAEQTIDDANYYVDTSSEPCRIQAKSTYSWPETDCRPAGIKVTFVAGWTQASLVPKPLRMAITLLAAAYYENREAYSDIKFMPIPFGVDSLMDLFRWHSNSFVS